MDVHRLRWHILVDQLEIAAVIVSSKLLTRWFTCFRYCPSNLYIVLLRKLNTQIFRGNSQVCWAELNSVSISKSQMYLKKENRTFNNSHSQMQSVTDTGGAGRGWEDSPKCRKPSVASLLTAAGAPCILSCTTAHSAAAFSKDGEEKKIVCTNE